QRGDALDLDEAAVGGIVQVTNADPRHRREVLAEVLAVDAADPAQVLLVIVGVEDVDGELDDVGHVPTGGAHHRLDVAADLAELGHDVALADDRVLLVARDLPRDVHEAAVLDLVSVGVAVRLGKRARLHGRDVILHGVLPVGAVPSRTTVSPLSLLSLSKRRTASATSAGSISRPPGFRRAIA